MIVLRNTPAAIALLDFMVAQAISFIFWVPTIMVNIANQDLLAKWKLEALRKGYLAERDRRWTPTLDDTYGKGNWVRCSVCPLDATGHEVYHHLGHHA